MVEVDKAVDTGPKSCQEWNCERSEHSLYKVFLEIQDIIFGYSCAVLLQIQKLVKKGPESIQEQDYPREISGGGAY